MGGGLVGKRTIPWRGAKGILKYGEIEHHLVWKDFSCGGPPSPLKRSERFALLHCNSRAALSRLSQPVETNRHFGSCTIKKQVRKHIASCRLFFLLPSLSTKALGSSLFLHKCPSAAEESSAPRSEAPAPRTGSLLRGAGLPFSGTDGAHPGVDGSLHGTGTESSVRVACSKERGGRFRSAPPRSRPRSSGAPGPSG